MSLLKKLAGETLIYGISSILPRILHFIVLTIYLTRKIDRLDYGIYTDLYAYVTVILTILVYRMDTAFFRFGSNNKEIEKVFGTALIPLLFSTCVIVSVIYFLAEPIAGFLHYENAPHYIRWFSIILGLDAIATLFYGRFRLQSRPLRFMVYRIGNVVITLFFVFLFLEILPRFFPSAYEYTANFLGVNKEIDFVFLSNLFASAIVLLLMLPEFLNVKWVFDPKLWKKMFLYALPLVVVGIAGNINQAFAVPLQKFFLGQSIEENLADGGLYAAAAKIALLLNLFTVAFNYAAEPFFFNNANLKKSKEIYGQVGFLFLLAASLLLMGIIAYADIVQYIVGKDFREAMPIVPILLFSYLFLGLYYNVSIWYKLADKTSIGAYISIGGAVITLVVSLLFLPKYGKVASAWAALCCYFFMCVAGWWTGKKYYPIAYPMKKILFYFFLVLVTSLTMIYLKEVIGSSIPAMVVNTLLLVIFCLIIFFRDGKEIKAMVKMKG